MGPVLIWPNITIVVNVLQEILPGNHADRSVVISNIQKQMICVIPVLFGNGIVMPISYTHHALQQLSHSSFIDTLRQPIREWFTSE